MPIFLRRFANVSCLNFIVHYIQYWHIKMVEMGEIVFI